MGGLFNPVSEKIETIAYKPYCQDSTDLEAATKTITATVEATGVGNADYNKALTLPAPTDSRLVVKRICCRLNVVIDSMTAGTLYCRVYVDAQSANNRLFDLSWTTTGDKLSATDTHADALAAIFNLLKDGAAHTLYFFFWVDAGNAVLSLVQLWEAVGTCSASWTTTIDCSHKGFIWAGCDNFRIGSGTPYLVLKVKEAEPPDKDVWSTTIIWLTTHGGVTKELGAFLTQFGIYLMGYGTVATDLNYFASLIITLRKET